MAAYIGEPGSPGYWNAQLTPVLGLRVARLHVAVNPSVDLRLSGSGRELELNPAAMVMFALDARNALGLELHAALGPLRRFAPSDEQNRVLFLAWNHESRAFALNAGIGRGLTDASESWIAKAILGFNLD